MRVATSSSTRRSHGAIATFRAEMLDEHDDARRSWRPAIETRRRNPVTGAIEVVSAGGNTQAVAARMKACVVARQIAEDLRLEADQSLIPTKLKKLRDELPELK